MRGWTEEEEEDVTGSRQPFLCVHRKARSDPELREGAARLNFQSAGNTSALFLEKRRHDTLLTEPKALESHEAFLLLFGEPQTSLKARVRLSSHQWRQRL